MPRFRKSTAVDQETDREPANPAGESSTAPSPAAASDDGESATSVEPISSGESLTSSLDQSVAHDGQPSDDTERDDPVDEEPETGSVARMRRLLSPNRRVAIGLFVLATALLIVELLSIPAIPAGLLVAASFVITVLVAPLIHFYKLQAVRHVVIPLAATSGTLTVARWPVIFQHNPADLAVQVLAILGLAWILAKLLLLQRFSARHCCRTPFMYDELNKLLPFQRLYLEQMRKAIFSAPIGQGARVVQLEANWGQGKSFLIERLELFLQSTEDEQGDCAVVVINVWEQESEPNLHLAIVEQILSHPKYWYPYGWLHYPPSLFVARMAKEWRLALSAGKEPTKAEMQIPLTLPTPTGRRYLEQQVDRVRKNGTRTVVVLDEIDRAIPRVAQSAMTIARRSLDMPGVVVILAYVDHVIRYKAFNPLVKSLPDLASTMRAVIFDRGPEAAIDGPGATPGGPFTEPNPASLREWEAWRGAAEAWIPGPTANGTQASKEGQANLDTVDRLDCRLSAALQLAFANAGVSERRQLQKKFSERYTGTDRIQMTSLKLEDVALVVVRFDTVRNRFLGLLGVADGADIDRDEEQRLVDTISSALKAANLEPHEPPTLRILEGALLRCFSGVNPILDAEGKPVRFSNNFIAAVVLTAYHAAARNML